MPSIASRTAFSVGMASLLAFAESRTEVWTALPGVSASPLPHVGMLPETGLSGGVTPDASAIACRTAFSVGTASSLAFDASRTVVCTALPSVSLPLPSHAASLPLVCVPFFFTSPTSERALRTAASVGIFDADAPVLAIVLATP